MTPYLAPSLAALRAEINARWPGRDKTSDGWIGDTRHQATKSDHNPNERGSVNAIDVDKDGVDMMEIIAAFEKHPSAHYWIYRGLIADKDENWRRRIYTGSNPHDKHGHFSIRQSRTAEQDTRPWGLIQQEDIMATLADLRQAIRDELREALPLQSQGLRNANPAVKEISMRQLLEYAWSDARQASSGVAALRAELARMAGRDLVDERQLAAELAPALLAVLTPQAIAAAIPAELAGQVADELSRRMAS